MLSNTLLLFSLSMHYLLLTHGCNVEGEDRIITIENTTTEVIQVCFNEDGALEWKFVCLNNDVVCLRTGLAGTDREGIQTQFDNSTIVTTKCTIRELVYCNLTTDSCNYVNQSDYCLMCHNSQVIECGLYGNLQQGDGTIGIAVGSVLSIFLIVTISLTVLIFVLFKCTRVKNGRHAQPDTIRSISRSSNRYGALTNDPTNNAFMMENSFDSLPNGYETLPRNHSGSYDSYGSDPIVSLPCSPSRRLAEPIREPTNPTNIKNPSDNPHEDFYASLTDGYIDLNVHSSITRRVVSRCYDYTAPDKIYVEPPHDIKLLRQFSTKIDELDKDKLDLGKQIAHGQFGIVYSAMYRSPHGDVSVAVKKLKDYSNRDAEAAFRREAMILAQFNHPNVLSLIGVVSGKPYMMVTELLKSELRELLIKLKESQLDKCQLLPPLLLQFCLDITNGMKYLADMQFIHRDLAARNVLVSKDLTCRIADFGMSRQFDTEGDYTSKGGQIPLRWCAPEAVFYKKYSEKSDVWSLGMTMYEIWSLGIRPWHLYTNEEILEALTVGTKLPPPTGCNLGVYKTMVETWRVNKSDRLTFSEVLKRLSEIQLPNSTPQTNPMFIIGNDPTLSVGLYKDLQNVH